LVEKIVEVESGARLPLRMSPVHFTIPNWAHKKANSIYQIIMNILPKISGQPDFFLGREVTCSGGMALYLNRLGVGKNTRHCRFSKLGIHTPYMLSFNSQECLDGTSTVDQ
jgi:hypothetical protein